MCAILASSRTLGGGAGAAWLLLLVAVVLVLPPSAPAAAAATLRAGDDEMRRRAMCGCCCCCATAAGGATQQKLPRSAMASAMMRIGDEIFLQSDTPPRIAAADGWSIFWVVIDDRKKNTPHKLLWPDTNTMTDTNGV
jgi:hypothetical protein